MVSSVFDVPVVGAPMAGGPSTPELVTAVGEAGGLGFLAGGYLTAAQLAAQIAEVWAATPRPFGVNLFVPSSANTYVLPEGGPYAAELAPLEGADRAAAVSRYRDSLGPEADRLGVELPQPRPADSDDWDRKLDLVKREGVAAVSFTFGLPSRAVFIELSRAGIDAAVTVTDVGEAMAALEMGADALVVQGPEAGGHRGTLHEAKRPSTTDLVTLVHDVRALTDLPIVAAGGISGPERAAEARAAGATTVQVGTALLLTPEAGTNLAYRRALRDPDHDRTVLTRAFSGRCGRALETDFVRAHHAAAPAAYPEVNQVTSVLRRAAVSADDAGLLALWAGTGWRSAREMPAAAVVRYIAGLDAA